MKGESNSCPRMLLQAELYVTDFRPVPLEEFIKVGPAFYNKNMQIARSIRKGADCGGKDPDHVVELCHEVFREGHSVLVFCSSRKACETTAQHVAKCFFHLFHLLNVEGRPGLHPVLKLWKSFASPHRAWTLCWRSLSQLE
ncbi:hypothetical protein R1sor_025766 [Riccia sorocarpa]|uniref:Uncharacterized protein n=1 Tax=Riccia sorocarpa TaxID=122646 RepID=A0ABD3GA21_9MARC